MPVTWSEPSITPPPESRTIECEVCGARAGHWAELYDLTGAPRCLDCAAEHAFEIVAGTPRSISEAELQLCFAALENWVVERRSDLMSPSAVALRAAFRAQKRSIP